MNFMRKENILRKPAQTFEVEVEEKKKRVGATVSNSEMMMIVIKMTVMVM